MQLELALNWLLFLRVMQENKKWVFFSEYSVHVHCNVIEIVQPVRG